MIARLPERFARIVVSNTGLPMGGGKVTDAFRFWASIASQGLESWGALVQDSTLRTLSAAEVAAYDAPFPTEEYKPATRVYPQLVPQSDAHMSVEENKGAFRRVLSRWQKPLLTLFSDSDPVSAGGERFWKGIPGAKLTGIPHTILHGGHFVQEDAGDEIVRLMLQLMRDFPVDAPPNNVASARL